MNRSTPFRFGPFRFGGALFALALALPAVAQEVVPPPTPNADRLAEEMRVLARDPRNVRALLSAGELTARLNDPSAAAAFFARAQMLDPTNPRLQAGQAMVMVRMERPGEALRLFAEAERARVQMEPYASDRGLAYDLLGAQLHAQREHRVAMRGEPDDEAIRRYALSLGISGKTAEAMTVLDPLLRRSDRAAWRARAFIMAMGGDVAGADRIAASMMGGFGSALSPFFRKLPGLSAADRAFAVHFGEMRRTPARIADASTAPPLPQLPQERGTAVVSVQMPGADQPEAREARRVPVPARREQSGAERRAAQRAAREAEARRVAEARAAQERETKRLADLRVQQEREALAARQRETERLAAAQQAAREAETRRLAEMQTREAEVRRLAEVQTREREAAEAAARQREVERVAQASVQPPVPVVAPPAPPPIETAPVAVAEQPVVQPPATDPSPPPQPAQSAAVQSPPPAIGREDNVIARIVAGITIPASELGVDPMPGRAPTPEPLPEPTAPVVAAAEPPPRPAPERLKPEPAPAKAKEADTKAATAKAKADAAKAAAAKAKAKPDPAKAEPARHWAQVAGGADVKALPKEWKKLVEKAPAEFRGKQAWTTPLRFTNRVLAGPFKTPAEAQAFVNAIGKKGISAFSWTSEAGQKIEKLAVK